MVYIVLVNWNGWRDTVECLESVFRLNHDNFRVIVCDNASRDHSLDRIAEWAEGDLSAGCANPELQYLSSPAVPKPISFLRLEPGERISLSARTERLILVQTGANLGFAGGNNVGLRMALAAGDLEYAWLLNNDTVVEPEALSALVETMRRRPDVGICGSTLLYYQRPQTIQALGGATYNYWSARMAHVGSQMDRKILPSSEKIARRIDYIVGASMMVSRAFLEQIGLLHEQYFLYYEEIDWATRAKGKFALAFCSRSIVYHKEGSSTGSADHAGSRSTLTEFYATRSRILFTRTYYPLAIATVCPVVAMSFVHRLLSGNPRNARALARGIVAAIQPGTIASPVDEPFNAS